MKAILLFLSLFLLTTLCDARTVRRAVAEQPQPALPSRKPQVQNGMVIRTIQQDSELKDWIGGILTENQKNSERADAAEASQKQVASALQQADSRADEMQSQLEKLQKERDAAVARYHRLKTLCCLIGSALAVMIALRFSALIPPPYNFVAIGGAGVLVFGFLWMIL